LSHEAIDLGGLKPSLDKVDTKHRQLLELEPQRIGIPGAGLAEPVQRDAERAQLRSVEMVDDDAGDFRNALRLGDLPQAVAFDDGPVGVDQDRPA
jgi:hypothetical protein